MNIPRKIVVSYSWSWDSEAHKDRILALADRLRTAGLDCHIDQYEVAPPQGWARWMREHIEQSDYVLVVCTAIYNRRVTGDEQKAVAWEKQLLEDSIFQTEAQNTKAIPVLFSPADELHIPIFLGTVSFYVLYTSMFKLELANILINS